MKCAREACSRDTLHCVPSGEVRLEVTNVMGAGVVGEHLTLLLYTSIYNISQSIYIDPYNLILVRGNYRKSVASTQLTNRLFSSFHSASLL